EGLRGRPERDQHQGGALVRDPLRSQVVPEPAGIADPGGGAGGDGHALPQGLGGPGRHSPPVPPGPAPGAQVLSRTGPAPSTRSRPLVACAAVGGKSGVRLKRFFALGAFLVGCAHGAVAPAAAPAPHAVAPPAPVTPPPAAAPAPAPVAPSRPPDAAPAPA